MDINNRGRQGRVPEALMDTPRLLDEQRLQTTKEKSMNHLKKVLFGLALAVALVSFGAQKASADCTPNKPVAVAGSVHAEGTTELLASFTLVCTNNVGGVGTAAAFTAGIPSNLSIVFSPTTTKVT